MMALTQPSRLAGPSWDEEVVPALRKRMWLTFEVKETMLTPKAGLESESRTLARRMSAISLSSVDEPSSANYSPSSDNTGWQKQLSSQTNSTQQPYGLTQALQSSYQRQETPSRTTPTTTRVNGSASVAKPGVKTEFQRARTYSSPYASDAANGRANGNGRPNPNTSKPAANPVRSLSPRPVDIKPTRIPKASRTPISVPSSSASSPYTNGYSQDVAVKPYSTSPEQPSQTLSDQRGAQRGINPSSSTQTTVELSTRSTRHTPGLLNESPPFPTDSTMSSGFTQASNYNAAVEESPPRASTESEERPYEHWYRGEVSRNGGVGELRVGRRQEMLDIANYGHMIESRQAAKRMAAMNTEEATPRARKRAGSIAGITNKERERGSLYLDEEIMDESARVLDEHPLTDLDGEGSEIQSVSDVYDGGAYAYLPGVGDVSTPSTEWTTVAGAHEFRSTTPTASMLPRPSSRQQQPNPPPTRIPGPSSRRSSESRSTVNSSPAIGGSSQFSASKSSSPPPAPSSSSNSRQMNHANTTSPTVAQKRGASPASKISRGGAPKMVKAKTLPGKRDEGGNRGSVAYYPTPGEDGEDMADAIPSWTQPVPGEGNWDDVSFLLLASFLMVAPPLHCSAY